MFKGVYTALITPFKDNGAVDFEAFKRIIEHSIEGGVRGIVPCGTTGESPTLSHEEHDKVIEATVQYSRGRVPVIAGTGSNSTAEAVRLTKHAEKAGATAALVVSPYYNKPTQEGLYRHFREVARSVSIPIIVYNIKGRTGVNIETSTLLRLIKDCSNIRGVKEASGDIVQIRDVISRAPKDFSVLSGDDNMTFDLIQSGGHGVISVASNIIPGNMTRLVSLALDGNFNGAKTEHDSLCLLFEALFVETNPIPVKYMMAKKGFCKEVYRLPLCEASSASKDVINKVLNDEVFSR